MRLFNSRQTRQAHPAQVILLGFAAVILAGTLLLYLPIARTGADGPSFMAALFTATSAVAVTGHVIVDTPTYWSAFGEAASGLQAAVAGGQAALGPAMGKAGKACSGCHETFRKKQE